MALTTIGYNFQNVTVAADSHISLVSGAAYYAPADTTNLAAGRHLDEVMFSPVGVIAIRGPGIIDVTAYAEGNIANRMAAGDWSIADSATALKATVTIVNVPNLNGGELVAFEWSMDAGVTWTPMVRLTAGTEDITTGAGAKTVYLRVITRKGENQVSASKAVTVA